MTNTTYIYITTYESDNILYKILKASGKNIIKTDNIVTISEAVSIYKSVKEYTDNLTYVFTTKDTMKWVFSELINQSINEEMFEICRDKYPNFKTFKEVN